ncbi:hypothetical protein M3G15_21000 [Paenibacillus sp. p3-SID1389]|uniref:hypothetical protein n=1 Tax=Paenibacillus sp. p3-SID1389 TaxID=2916364 RepID=UPI0021A70E3B|nr:hypothetical protein [Paenibacillus sp. p3-SID1389]MCT2197592.1 hypothetical protein [Paenibacillus sp. p3-SID1389]
MSGNVKVQIDLKNGSVLVEAPDESIDRIFDRLEHFLPKFNTNYRENEEIDTFSGDSEAVEKQSHNDEETNKGTENKNNHKPQNKNTNKKSTSSRGESLKVVDLPFSSEQRRKLKEFYESKKPTNQNQQLLVVIYWLVIEGNMKELTKEEIFTGLRITGDKAPKRISSVISNLLLEGYILSDGGKYKLHHTGEDFVMHDLPKKPEK